MKGFSLLLLAASLVAVASNPNEDSTSCVLEATLKDGDSYYTCGDDGDDGDEIRISDALVRVANATCGDTLTFASSAVSNGELAADASVDVSRIEGRLVSNGPRGTATVLVIRLEDKFGREPGASINKLENDFFDDSACLESQMDDCSYGKFKIAPFKGYTPRGVFVDNGVVDVKMNNFDIDIPGNYDDVAVNNAIDQLGRIGQIADFIFFCFPDGNQGFKYSANGFKNIFLTDPYCSYVSYQMNTLGWNLGLGRSGEDGGSAQGDETGEMGFPSDGDTFRRCFNPAKSYQLGWYADQTYVYNPLDTRYAATREFTLNGVADYQVDKDNYISILLRQWSAYPYILEDYYIGYNRAVGIHEDTEDNRNEVTIVKKINNAGPFVRGDSLKVASLDPGQGFEIEPFTYRNGQVDVEFVRTRNNGRDAVIRIIRRGGTAPPGGFPTSSPKPSTNRPTTNSSTRRPTNRPTTNRPTNRLTLAF